MSSCGWVVASPPWRRGCQVRAPWRHGGHGVVDVVGPVAPPGRASDRGDAGVYTDRRKRTLGAVLDHLCTLLRRCGQTWRRRSVHRSAKMASRSRFGSFVYTVALWAWFVGGLGIAIVYTNGRIGSLGTVLGHLCTLLRRELRRVTRAPQPPWRADSAPRWPASPLAGKTGSARVAPPPGWRFH